MRKLLPYVFGALFPLFILAVAGGVMYYSYRGLGLIFPGDLTGQLFGLCLFDVSAFVWFGVFISRCRSTMQYVFSIFGFTIGMVGTLGLIGIEIGISSGWLDAAGLAQPLTYVFVGVLIGHLLLIYAFHAATPEVSAEISLGIEKAKITDRAKDHAEKMLQDNQDVLALPIANDLVAQVARDMRLNLDAVKVIDATALDVVKPRMKQEGGAVQNFFSRWARRWGVGGRKYAADVPSVIVNSGTATPKPSPAQGDAGPDAGGESTLKS